MNRGLHFNAVVFYQHFIDPRVNLIVSFDEMHVLNYIVKLLPRPAATKSMHDEG